MNKKKKKTSQIQRGNKKLMSQVDLVYNNSGSKFSLADTVKHKHRGPKYSPELHPKKQGRRHHLPNVSEKIYTLVNPTVNR